MRIVVDKAAAPKFKANLAGIGDRVTAALSAAANMAASLIQTEAREDIRKAGNFSGPFVEGLHVEVEQQSVTKMRIAMYHDDPRAALFETGGVIKGHPLLWLPLGNAPRIAQNSDPLFSGKSKAGNPLLFSKATKEPKYVGVPQVSIPKKFHLREIQSSVMSRFKDIFDQEFRKA